MSPADIENQAETVNDQITRLRSQVDQLINERVSPALSSAAERAGQAARDAAETAQDQAEVLAERVRGRPILSLAIAAGVGFILGRALR